MRDGRERRLNRVMLLLRSLHGGGAERQVVNLAKGLAARGVVVTVVLFYREGGLLNELEGAGIECLGLQKRGRFISPAFVTRLVDAVRATDPDLVYTFLEATNIVGALLKGAGVVRRLVWGVRSSDMKLGNYGLVHAAVHLGQAPMRRLVDGIVFNSNAGARHGRRLGLTDTAMAVIPNGIDVQRFRPDEDARHRLRSAWSLAEADRLVGVVARVDPMKDHGTFLDAACRVADVDDRVRFLCAGGGVDEILPDAVRRRGLDGRVRLLGRSDSVAVMNALDCLVLSSAYGEGFPNVVGEAMACGTPCVVTDVGDAAVIVDGLGSVVRPSDPAKLADAILSELQIERDPDALRRRIEDEYGVERMIDRTCDFLDSILEVDR